MEEVDPPVASVSYQITVKQDKVTLAERVGTLFLEGAPLPVRRGMLLVCADAGPTVYTEPVGPGMQNRETDVKHYILNVATFFTGGRRGRFAVFDAPLALGAPFRETLRQAGHTVETYRTEPTYYGPPSHLDNYDGIFYGERLIDSSLRHYLLRDYIARGGKVYMPCGAVEMNYTWNVLMERLGMGYGGNEKPQPQRITDLGPHPLFTGVKELCLAGQYQINVAQQASNVHVLLKRNVNLWAVHTTAPLPPTNMGRAIGIVDADPLWHTYLHSCYQLISVPDGLSWMEAEHAARKRTFGGNCGRLATIESEGENRTFVRYYRANLTQGCWFGGFQDTSASDFQEPGGGWRWITGDKWTYTNWSTEPVSEPDNAPGGNANYLAITPDGRWHDYPNVGSAEKIKYYLVEYKIP